MRIQKQFLNAAIIFVLLFAPFIIYVGIMNPSSEHFMNAIIALLVGVFFAICMGIRFKKK